MADKHLEAARRASRASAEDRADILINAGMWQNSPDPGFSLCFHQYNCSVQIREDGSGVYCYVDGMKRIPDFSEGFHIVHWKPIIRRIEF